MGFAGATTSFQLHIVVALVPVKGTASTFLELREQLGALGIQEIHQGLAPLSQFLGLVVAKHVAMMKQQSQAPFAGSLRS